MPNCSAGILITTYSKKKVQWFSLTKCDFLLNPHYKMQWKFIIWLFLQCDCTHLSELSKRYSDLIKVLSWLHNLDFWLKSWLCKIFTLLNFTWESRNLTDFNVTHKVDHLTVWHSVVKLVTGSTSFFSCISDVKQEKKRKKKRLNISDLSPFEFGPFEILPL